MALGLKPCLFIAPDLGSTWNKSFIIIIIYYCAQWRIDEQKWSLTDTSFLAPITLCKIGFLWKDWSIAMKNEGQKIVSKPYCEVQTVTSGYIFEFTVFGAQIRTIHLKALKEQYARKENSQQKWQPLFMVICFAMDIKIKHNYLFPVEHVCGSR